MLREIKGDALRYLVRLVQFKNRAKHSSRCVTFITKSNRPPWVSFMFLKFVQALPTPAKHQK